jgi:hypothetical protein
MVGCKSIWRQDDRAPPHVKSPCERSLSLRHNQTKTQRSNQHARVTCVAVRDEHIPAAGASTTAKRHDPSTDAARTGFTPHTIRALFPQRNTLIGTGRKERQKGAGTEPSNRLDPVCVSAQYGVELTAEHDGGGGVEQ